MNQTFRDSTYDMYPKQRVKPWLC